jgi:hypothetical protein
LSKVEYMDGGQKKVLHYTKAKRQENEA